jgi:hypothetical protein
MPLEPPWDEDAAEAVAAGAFVRESRRNDAGDGKTLPPAAVSARTRTAR